MTAGAARTRPRPRAVLRSPPRGQTPPPPPAGPHPPRQRHTWTSRTGAGAHFAGARAGVRTEDTRGRGPARKPSEGQGLEDTRLTACCQALR